jgi:hypothetical protein
VVRPETVHDHLAECHRSHRDEKQVAAKALPCTGRIIDDLGWCAEGHPGARNASSQGRRQLESCQIQPSPNKGDMGFLDTNPLSSSCRHYRRDTIIMAWN